jgi:hypothetical protein
VWAATGSLNLDAQMGEKGGKPDDITVVSIDNKWLTAVLGIGKGLQAIV